MTGRRVEPSSISSDGTSDASVFVIAGLLKRGWRSLPRREEPNDEANENTGCGSWRPITVQRERDDGGGWDERRRGDEVTTRRGGTSRFNEL